MDSEKFEASAIDQSIKTPENILDETIRRNFKLILNSGRMARPKKFSGNFCVAYPMTGNGGEICCRVWNRSDYGFLERYREFEKFKRQHSLSYFLDFRTIDRLLKMPGGQVLPGLQMVWQKGETLDVFLANQWKNLNEPQRKDFIRKFYKMCFDLRQNGYSHGDLSSANIMVTPARDLKLLDYDSVYVSGMKHKQQTVSGTSGYRHPDRESCEDSSLFDDNFSQLVIALSLWGAYYDPAIAEDWQGAKHMLFLPSDFEEENRPKSRRQDALIKSEGWKKAKQYSEKDGEIARLMQALKEAVIADPYKVPCLGMGPFSGSLAEKSKVPTKYYVRYCTNCGHLYNQAENVFAYCPVCGRKRHIFSQL